MTWIQKKQVKYLNKYLKIPYLLTYIANKNGKKSIKEYKKIKKLGEKLKEWKIKLEKEETNPNQKV